jgi:hypothetical protein
VKDLNALVLEFESAREEVRCLIILQRLLVGLDVLICQVADLMVDMEQAFLIRHIELQEFGFQNIVREVHVFHDVLLAMVFQFLCVKECSFLRYATDDETVASRLKDTKNRNSRVFKLLAIARHSSAIWRHGAWFGC